MVPKLFAASILAAMTFNANAIVFDIAGKPMSCNKVGNFLTMPVSDFSSWSARDFDTARKVLGNCYSKFSSKPAEIEARLNEVQNTLADQRTQERKQQQERSQQSAACRETPEYRRYAAERGMLETQLRITQLEEAQKREQEYAKASGVRNLANERNLGVALVDSRQWLNQQFENYKRAGGSAASPTAITQASANPCIASYPQNDVKRNERSGESQSRE